MSFLNFFFRPPSLRIFPDCLPSSEIYSRHMADRIRIRNQKPEGTAGEQDNAASRPNEMKQTSKVKWTTFVHYLSVECKVWAAVRTERRNPMEQRSRTGDTLGSTRYLDQVHNLILFLILFFYVQFLTGNFIVLKSIGWKNISMFKGIYN